MARTMALMKSPPHASDPSWRWVPGSALVVCLLLLVGSCDRFSAEEERDLVCRADLYQDVDLEVLAEAATFSERECAESEFGCQDIYLVGSTALESRDAPLGEEWNCAGGRIVRGLRRMSPSDDAMEALRPEGLIACHMMVNSIGARLHRGPDDAMTDDLGSWKERLQLVESLPPGLWETHARDDLPTMDDFVETTCPELGSRDDLEDVAAVFPCGFGPFVAWGRVTFTLGRCVPTWEGL